MNELATRLIALGQQVLQQGGSPEEGASVCIVGLAPILLAAAVVGLASLRRRLGAANPRPSGE